MERRRDGRDEEHSREDEREREVALLPDRRELEDRREEEEVQHRLQERLAPEADVEVDDGQVGEPGEVQDAVRKPRHGARRARGRGGRRGPGRRREGRGARARSRRRAARARGARATPPRGRARGGTAAGAPLFAVSGTPLHAALPFGPPPARKTATLAGSARGAAGTVGRRDERERAQEPAAVRGSRSGGHEHVAEEESRPVAAREKLQREAGRLGDAPFERGVPRRRSARRAARRRARRARRVPPRTRAP